MAQTFYFSRIGLSNLQLLYPFREYQAGAWMAGGPVALHSIVVIFWKRILLSETI
ncbi:hypothetical protein BDV27DRAFT_130424 [Aspergillus caelatus]|uniref:Uncharacterized protein n=1 Tax=Aspergillus caelatus TaxID=61420 RepID=A0A5N7A0E0_9EURO|nr:uncharacterized protein BDV27DRAFT_130424 [Aspergillus caelatus]KAE8363145.1 hypothetical protein BDV27DRAFT_130424 [Aspergillus caelatus]